MPITRFTPRAMSDLLAIENHIAQQNPSAAERVIEVICSTAKSIARTPVCGEPCPRMSPGLRRFPSSRYPYVIYFRPISGGIRVVRILHASRDPARQFWVDESE